MWIFRLSSRHGLGGRSVPRRQTAGQSRARRPEMGDEHGLSRIWANGERLRVEVAVGLWLDRARVFVQVFEALLLCKPAGEVALGILHEIIHL